MDRAVAEREQSHRPSYVSPLLAVHAIVEYGGEWGIDSRSFGRARAR
jgi:hypothetical protein